MLGASGERRVVVVSVSQTPDLRRRKEVYSTPPIVCFPGISLRPQFLLSQFPLFPGNLATASAYLLLPEKVTVALRSL